MTRPQLVPLSSGDSIEQWVGLCPAHCVISRRTVAVRRIEYNRLRRIADGMGYEHDIHGGAVMATIDHAEAIAYYMGGDVRQLRERFSA
jgi:hypothetical protein